MIRSGRQFAEANHEIIVVRLGRGLLQLMHLQILKLLQQVGNMYMKIWKNRHQYMNIYVFCAELYPSLSQYEALALR